MPIDTGAFIAGVGVLVTMDILSLTAIFALTRRVGKDAVARQRAEKALRHARRADAEVRTDGGRRGPLARVLRWLRRRSLPTEDAAEYDGVLSYAGEWHALVIGLSTGLTAAVLAKPTVLVALFVVALGISGVEVGHKFRGRKVVNEMRREPWYACGGALVAYVAAGGGLGAVASAVPLPV
jgi:hypothetical protein